MLRIKNREFLVKVSSISFVIFLFILVLIPIDKILLFYASNKRQKYLTTKGIAPEIQKIAKESTNYKDSGPAIKEGGLLSDGEKAGYNHERFSDYESFGNGKQILWILGDSWIALLQNNHFNIFENNLINNYSTLRIFSNSSWSPLLYSLVIRNRSNKYNQKPDAVAIYLDQTDIGDDYCRYRPLVVRDNNNRLIRVNTNKFITYYNHDFTFHVLFEEHSSGIIYAIKYLIYRVFYAIRFLPPGIAACEYEDIMAWNLGKEKTRNGVYTKNYVNYFKRTLSELRDELIRLNPKVKILFITHEWAQHGLEKKHNNHFKKNISSIIEEVFSNDQNVELINITTKDHFSLNPNSDFIYDYPEDKFSHLLQNSYDEFASFISEGIKQKLFHNE